MTRSLLHRPLRRDNETLIKCGIYRSQGIIVPDTGGEDSSVPGQTSWDVFEILKSSSLEGRR